MNEQEWLECADPRLALVFLEGRTTDRKARLFASGLGRYLFPFLGDQRSREVVDVAEKSADGLATSIELLAANETALDARKGQASQVISCIGDHHAWQAARMVVRSIQQAAVETPPPDWGRNTAARSRKILHCVFGNPFRPTAIDPAWLTSKVQTLAQSIYAERHFTDMPLLADALAEAGCTDTEVLNHCRQPGEHMRGCWVVDLLLGKA